MPRKHEIDPVTQGSLLAPAPGSVAVDRTVELEQGAYYQEPEAEVDPEKLSPEQQVKSAEVTALELMGRACKTKATINNMDRARHGLVRQQGYDADPTEADRLAAAIRKSQTRYSDLRRAAKQSFAKSIGVETETVQDERFFDGSPQAVLIVRAADPERQAEFVAKFREFDKTYGQPKQGKAREQRRQQIIKEITGR